MGKVEVNWRYFAPYAIGGVIFLAILGVVVEAWQQDLGEKSLPEFEIGPNAAKYASFLLKQDERLEIKITITEGDRTLYYQFRDVEHEAKTDWKKVQSNQPITWKPPFDGTFTIWFENRGGSQVPVKEVSLTYKIVDTAALLPVTHTTALIVFLGSLSTLSLGYWLKDSFKKKGTGIDNKGHGIDQAK